MAPRKPSVQVQEEELQTPTVLAAVAQVMAAVAVWVIPLLPAAPATAL